MWQMSIAFIVSCWLKVLYFVKKNQDYFSFFLLGDFFSVFTFVMDNFDNISRTLSASSGDIGRSLVCEGFRSVPSSSWDGFLVVIY
jgi:hypothetical protein